MFKKTNLYKKKLEIVKFANENIIKILRIFVASNRFKARFVKTIYKLWKSV